MVETLFSWIHLSSLHFGSRNTEQSRRQAMVLEALRKDIATSTARGCPPPDAILVTGDVAYRGNAHTEGPDYAGARDWLLEVRRAAGLGPEAIFVVPGNHDVARAGASDRDTARLLRALRKGEECIDDALEEEKERGQLVARQAEYLTFAADIGPPLLGTDRLFWTHRWQVRGLPVRLIGLNTALLAGADDKLGAPYLGAAQLAPALMTPPLERDELVVVLSHQPFRGGSLADGEEADAWVRNHAHVHLSGYVHDASSEEARYGTNKRLVRISAGAAADGRGPPGLHYNVATAARTANDGLTLRLWPRVWSDKNKAFRPDINNLPDGREHAEYPIRNPCLGEDTTTSSEISLASLPRLEGPIFGRNTELQALDDAWWNPRTHVVAIVGWGGSGKSQLVRRWLADRATPIQGAAGRVFGWSFYAQGAGPRAAVSADLFFAKALAFFGDTLAPEDPWDRAQKLVRLIRQQRTLLVLDGMEPLQDPVRGVVRDQALQFLLNELVASMDGLCVLTTRPPFKELEGFEGTSAYRINLPGLSADAGVELLRHRGIHGEDAALRAAVNQYQGHALSLTVLGTYLSEAWQGDIQQREGVRLTEEDVDDERRLRRLLASYDACLGDGPRQVLRAMSLFDRPTPVDCVQALRQGRAIPGMADTSGTGSEARWNKAVARLRGAGLLTQDDRTGALDAHPLIRQHFAEVFEQEDVGAFCAAHGRLFEHLRSSAPPQPETLDEMQPLYRVVGHGCRALRWDDAFDVLYTRIRQGDEHVSLKKLGAVSADLEAFASFFSDAWQPVPGLSPWQRYWLQNSAGVLQRAEGRLDDAWKLLADALETALVESWSARAAESARNLASTESAMGRLTDALATVERAISFAEESGELRARIVSRDFRAHLLNRLGRLQESRALFEEIELIRVQDDHKGDLPHYPEASFAALLVELGEPEEACRRARRLLDLTSEPSSELRSLLNIALSERSLARALAALNQLDEAEKLFDESITHIRQAARHDHLAPGLVDRAKFNLRRDPSNAMRDIDDALRIAIQCGFRLVEADARLTRGRLEIDAGSAREAEESLRRARVILEETGFVLRMPMLLLTEAQLHVFRKDRLSAERALDSARRLAGEMGMLGLRAELDHVDRVVSDSA